ncbi:MAG TPA: superinfection immunity protein [Candidatus Scalindua sp.]|nr:superinfection immunity protein [Candidatus Scalindua sp.]
MELLIIIAAFVFYFVPSIAGWKTKGANGIIVLNLFLGWTIIGWVAALIWAVQSPKI